ncbi:glycosyltransferase family 4 protein [uncultured Paludibaculum sp.]|uniref:glycosyltransferase family 4 protein n=1 Tax=uncultured Paludibaculum sp. TaxID=1765020 RepID=UPI002AAABC7E|nr:glycosyltransferase family 4 protein [uncultured Paludibaculum sp.]
MSIERVVYCAAHGGFGGQAIPLGGGAAVSNLLLEEWGRTRPFELELLSPAILGGGGPSGRELVEFDERQYAAFCESFRAASTQAVLRHDPRTTAVLVNDISEGPDFAALQRAGFRIVTVYHVDVVAYIAAIYLKGRVSPRGLTRFWEVVRSLGLDRVAPVILRLIFAQQRASLVYSHAVVVPSAGMKEILLECYPKTPPERIHVVPWGAPPRHGPPEEAQVAAAALRREFEVPEDARVLLCLSRISPEKGQDVLLEALIEAEQTGRLPREPLWLFLCGEPAFMHGRRHMERLRSLAERLQRVKVVFPGYTMGLRKQAFFQLADLYVFPSRHESYGLTLMEALSEGLPAVCLEHQGSREVMTEAVGVMLKQPSRAELWAAIAGMLDDSERRERMSKAARSYAELRPFSISAGRLAGLLVE